MGAFGRRRRGYGRAGGMGIGTILLIAQIAQIGLEHIPPVTMAVVGFASVIEIGLLSHIKFFASRSSPFSVLGALSQSSPGQVCVSVKGTVPGILGSECEPIRFLIAPWKHYGDYHLYIVCAGILIRGRAMEPSMGSEAFLLLLFLLFFLTGVVYTALITSLYMLQICAPWLMAILTPIVGMVIPQGNVAHYLRDGDCVIGLGAVSFALQAIHSVNDYGERAFLFNLIRTQGRYAVFAELLINYLLLGHTAGMMIWHLSGALTGLLIVHVGKHWQFLDRVTAAGRSLTRFRQQLLATGHAAPDHHHRD